MACNAEANVDELTLLGCSVDARGRSGLGGRRDGVRGLLRHDLEYLGDADSPPSLRGGGEDRRQDDVAISTTGCFDGICIYNKQNEQS